MANYLPACVATPVLSKLFQGCVSRDAWERLAVLILFCRHAELSHHHHDPPQTQTVHICRNRHVCA